MARLLLLNVDFIIFLATKIDLENIIFIMTAKCFFVRFRAYVSLKECVMKEKTVIIIRFNFPGVCNYEKM